MISKRLDQEQRKEKAVELAKNADERKRSEGEENENVREEHERAKTRGPEILRTRNVYITIIYGGGIIVTAKNIHMQRKVHQVKNQSRKNPREEKVPKASCGIMH